MGGGVFNLQFMHSKINLTTQIITLRRPLSSQIGFDTKTVRELISSALGQLVWCRSHTDSIVPDNNNTKRVNDNNRKNHRWAPA